VKPSFEAPEGLVVRERLGLERPEAYHPLRSSRRRLTRNCRSGEARLRIGVDAVVFGDPEQAASAKRLLDTPDREVEHVADFTGPEVPQPPKDEIPLLLVPGAVQENTVEVGIEPQVGRRSLQDRDAAGLAAQVALLARAACVEPLHRVLEDPGKGAEQRAILGEGEPPGKGEREHPLS